MKKLILAAVAAVSIASLPVKAEAYPPRAAFIFMPPASAVIAPAWSIAAFAMWKQELDWQCEVSGECVPEIQYRPVRYEGALADPMDRGLQASRAAPDMTLPPPILSDPQGTASPGHQDGLYRV